MIGIYCRVSTDDQNIDQQKKLLVKYCKDNKLKYRAYGDDGVSGYISDRREWKRLVKDCQNGVIDTILVVKVDRITRVLEYAVWFYKWLMKYDIVLISLYDSIDLDTPDGYFNFMLQCLLSERELLILKWRSRIGIKRAMAEGKYKGRKLGAKDKKQRERRKKK